MKFLHTAKNKLMFCYFFLCNSLLFAANPLSDFKSNVDKELNETMNSIQLCGNLGKDFEVQQHNKKSNGEVFFVARNSLAITQKSIHTNEKGEKVTIEHTDWIPITLFGKNAQNAAKFFKKGSKFLCEGQITTNTFTNDKGETQYSWCVEVRKYYFTQPKDESSTNSTQNLSHQMPEPPQEFEKTNVITDEAINNATETNAECNEDLPFG